MPAHLCAAGMNVQWRGTAQCHAVTLNLFQGLSLSLRVGIGPGAAPQRIDGGRGAGGKMGAETSSA